MSFVLPEFTPNGLLPPGTYPLTTDELRSSSLVKGPSPRPADWDEAWRSSLVDNLERLVSQLWQVGVDEIYVGGSFTDQKGRPNDIDGYYVCDFKEIESGVLTRKLDDLHFLQNPGASHRVWGMGRPSHRTQTYMWHQYRVELWAHTLGRFSGVYDRKRGILLDFPSLLRRTRSGAQCGIIAIARLP